MLVTISVSVHISDQGWSSVLYWFLTRATSRTMHPLRERTRHGYMGTMHYFRGIRKWKSEKWYFYKRESFGRIAFSEATCKHSHWRVTMQKEPEKWRLFRKRSIVRFGVHCVSRISELSYGAPQNRHANTLHSSGWRLVTIWSWVFFLRDPFILVNIDQNTDQHWSLFTFGYYLHQFL